MNRPHRSRRFIYFKALFSCKKHQGKIFKTQRVLVANLVTNFWILVASTIILVALATVLGAISCPELAGICRWKAVRFLSKQGQLQSHFHSKARQLSTQLLNGLLAGKSLNLMYQPTFTSNSSEMPRLNFLFIGHFSPAGRSFGSMHTWPTNWSASASVPKCCKWNSITNQKWMRFSMIL